jgi:hypothetical protein
MNRNIKKQLAMICATAAMAVVAAAAPVSKSHSKKAPQHPAKQQQRRMPGSKYSPAQAKKIIAERAQKVVLALKTNDTDILSQYVHPEWGVRIIPSIHPYKTDQIFSRAQVKPLAQSDKIYFWGYDPRTESNDYINGALRKTWTQYLHDNLYTHDFAASHDILYNTITSPGNNVNTLKQDYPDAILVRYYMPGRPDSHDWKELWLIWQRTSKGSDWYLAGIGCAVWGS